MKKILMTLLPAMALLFSCSHKSTRHTFEVINVEQENVALGYSDSSQASGNEAPKPKLMNPEGMIPKATAFKMSGDYADNVAITLDAAGNITYYPAVTDITINSMPVDLGNGWWLNRQGISRNSVFTTYTFRDYASLPSTPSREELKAAVIPGATVTEMIELPYSINEAQAKLPEIKQFLESR